MRPRRATSLAAVAVALAAALLAACGGGADRDALREVPMPELSAADASVRQQVEEAKAAVDRLRDEGAPAGELAEGYGELAMVLLTYEFSDAAEAALDNAHALEPDELRWTYLLAYFHQLQGNQERAGELFDAALDLDPDYLPARIRRGRLHLDLGDSAEARRQFEAALALDARSAAAHEGLGRAASADGDDAEAVSHLRHALELAPEASSLRYLLGQALRRQGDLEAAERELARAGDAPVGFPDPLLAPISGLAASAQFYIVQGSEALEDDRYEAAAVSFARAIEIDPASYVARKGMGYTLEKLGDAAGAEAQLRQALEHTAERAEQAEAHAILGGLLAAQGRDEPAVAELAASLELEPEQPAIRLRLADAYARLGRMAEAVALYDRVLADDPGNPGVLVRRGTARINLGQRQGGLADFRRAVELAPDDAGVRLRYAEALDFVGDRAGAAEQRRRAEATASEGDQRVARLAGEGRLATSRGDFATAVERYRQALALDAERHDVRSALAAVLGHLGRFDEALAEYRRVIEAAPELAPARRGEIAALVLSGRYGQARVRLNEALRRFSRDRELALTQARLLAASPDPRVRDGALAVQVASRVARDDRGLVARDTLAMALAEAGRPAEAAEIQRGVVAEAEASAPADYAARLRGRLEAYEAGRPWHAEGPEEILAFSGMG